MFIFVSWISCHHASYTALLHSSGAVGQEVAGLCALLLADLCALLLADLCACSCKPSEVSADAHREAWGAQDNRKARWGESRGSALTAPSCRHFFGQTYTCMHLSSSFSFM